MHYTSSIEFSLTSIHREYRTIGMTYLRTDYVKIPVPEIQFQVQLYINCSMFIYEIMN